LVLPGARSVTSALLVRSEHFSSLSEEKCSVLGLLGGLRRTRAT